VLRHRAALRAAASHSSRSYAVQKQPCTRLPPPRCTRRLPSATTTLRSADAMVLWIPSFASSPPTCRLPIRYLTWITPLHLVAVRCAPLPSCHAAPPRCLPHPGFLPRAAARTAWVRSLCYTQHVPADDSYHTTHCHRCGLRAGCVCVLHMPLPHARSAWFCLRILHRCHHRCLPAIYG